jgi:transposase
MDTVDNAITKPVHRLEVFTGAGRRRTWGDEDKARIVAEIAVSGESVSAVARRHGLSPQQLFGWRRQLQASQAALSHAEELQFVPAVWMWHRLLRPSVGNAKCHVARLSPVQE